MANSKCFCSFYAIRGSDHNYKFTFRVNNEKNARDLLKKFSGVRAAYLYRRSRLDNSIVFSKRLL